jgi:hypothetical protein
VSLDKKGATFGKIKSKLVYLKQFKHFGTISCEKYYIMLWFLLLISFIKLNVYAIIVIHMYFYKLKKNINGVDKECVYLCF